MVTVFSEHITERLIYTLDFFFKEKGEEYALITSEEDWNRQTTQVINYSNLNLNCQLQISPQGILFETEIYPSKKINFQKGNLLVDGVYDQFGIVFFLLTRYESYFSQKGDQHGRIPSQENSLVKFKLNQQAYADRVVKAVWKACGLDYTPVQQGYSFTPTFDIDVAWAYKHRKFIRSIGALVKGKKPLERFKVMAGMKKDPYDTYNEIRSIATRTNQIICFILLGDWGKYDKNIHWENAAYGSLIRGLNLEGEVGIHPSYASYLNPDQINTEIQRLAKITGHSIALSRQHFMRLKIPNTYQQLVNTSIKNDYSMGFADEVGFRAGTCFPFHFFDLTQNKKMDLLIHPFAYMDSALKDYMKVSPEDAIKQITQLINEVKQHGGNFMFIWHNSSIHNTGEWKGWHSVLNHTVEEGIMEGE